MLFLFACEITLRLVGMDLVAFRTFEPALQMTPNGSGPFRPEKTTRAWRAYGDLANMGNAWRLRQYHNEELHADRFGFRNEGSHSEYGGIVVGDSFSIASGVPESQTLPERLSQLSGIGFYNAGWNGALSPSELRYLAANLKIHGGIVVCEILERSIRIGPPVMDDKTSRLYQTPYAAQQALGAKAFLPWLTDVTNRLKPEAVSPMKVLSRKVVKRLQNGSLQPNPYWDLVVHRRLKNGDDMLFLTLDLQPIGDIKAISEGWRIFLQWYRDELQSQGFRLVVAFVPNKYTVYSPLLKVPPPDNDGARLLGEVTRKVDAAGVPVINLTPEFMSVAADDLPKHEYIYWRDDTHWNAAGINIAANSVWDLVRNSQQSSLAPSSAGVVPAAPHGAQP
jgi:hypothetical protein